MSARSALWLAAVRNLANDLDDDVRIGALGIDIGNANLGVVEVEFLDAVIDSLRRNF
jgi:hypothetical protein